jgi:hypothetical protein
MMVRVGPEKGGARPACGGGRAGNYQRSRRAGKGWSLTKFPDILSHSLLKIQDPALNYRNIISIYLLSHKKTFFRNFLILYQLKAE